MSITYHPPTKCAGEFCTIHNPSQHHMRGWPLVLRTSTLLERQCPHGIGHPDPDSWPVLDRLYGHPPGTWSRHGCDGCCNVAEAKQGSSEPTSALDCPVHSPATAKCFVVGCGQQADHNGPCKNAAKPEAETALGRAVRLARGIDLPESCLSFSTFHCLGLKGHDGEHTFHREPPAPSPATEAKGKRWTLCVTNDGRQIHTHDDKPPLLERACARSYRQVEVVPLAELEAEREEVRRAEKAMLDLAGAKNVMADRLAAAERALAEARKPAMCGVCAGSGTPVSGRPCVCGGVGTEQAELDGLRRKLFDVIGERDAAESNAKLIEGHRIALTAERDALRAKLEKALDPTTPMEKL